jgi:hypothetical protein
MSEKLNAAVSSIASFCPDSLRAKLQNYNGRDATESVRYFIQLSVRGPLLASRAAAPARAGFRARFTPIWTTRTWLAWTN